MALTWLDDPEIKIVSESECLRAIINNQDSAITKGNGWSFPYIANRIVSYSPPESLNGDNGYEEGRMRTHRLYKVIAGCAYCSDKVLALSDHEGQLTVYVDRLIVNTKIDDPQAIHIIESFRRAWANPLIGGESEDMVTFLFIE